MNALIDSIKGGLIVSIQQENGSPLDHPAIIAAMAQVVRLPDVVGYRLNAPVNVRAVRAILDLPIIGIHKVYDDDLRVWITPSYAHARDLVEAGANIIALDATDRLRPQGDSIAELIHRIHTELGVSVMADISTINEGLAAASAGADLIATTLSGYARPPFAKPFDPPDLELIARLVAIQDKPVLAEGRLHTPDLARQALQAGAHAVVVGSSITRPDFIAAMYLQAMRNPD